MRRLGLGTALALCALAGLVAAFALAGATPASDFTTSSGTTTSTTGGTTTSPPPPPTTTTAPPPPPAPAVIAAGVRVGNVDVGGLTPVEAAQQVRAGFARPLPLVVGGRRLAPTPSTLGAVPYVAPAIARARAAAPGARVTLFVRVDGNRVRAYVAALARRFDRTPADATLRLRNLRPFITPERVGRTLDRTGTTAALVARLRAGSRTPVRARLRVVWPAVTRARFGPVVVIRRGSNRLYLYSGMRLRAVFAVATGQSRYPTPLGRFTIVTMARNPWWYPPKSDWADGLRPVPPGPGNPLGTRWMGISSPGVGIHGTPDAASIGYSVSHGCIRMRIPDAERLFTIVTVGTPVFIVAA